MCMGFLNNINECVYGVSIWRDDEFKSFPTYTHVRSNLAGSSRVIPIHGRKKLPRTALNRKHSASFHWSGTQGLGLGSYRPASGSSVET